MFFCNTHSCLHFPIGYIKSQITASKSTANEKHLSFPHRVNPQSLNLLIVVVNIHMYTADNPQLGAKTSFPPPSINLIFAPINSDICLQISNSFAKKSSPQPGPVPEGAT